MSLVRMTASGIALLGGSAYAILTIVHTVGWSLQLGAMAALCVIVLLGSMLIEVPNQAQEEEEEPFSRAETFTRFE